MKIATTGSIDAMLKDRYPQPGERIKQYVVDERIADEWDRETCPRIDVPEHLDNTEVPCHVSGKVPWVSVFQSCSCGTCSDTADEARTRDDIIAWFARRAKERPTICADETKLSNEIAPDWPSLRSSWLFSLVKGAKP